MKTFLLLLWRLLVTLGNIEHFDSGILPALLRAFAWDVACIHHREFGHFPYKDWMYLVKHPPTDR